MDEIMLMAYMTKTTRDRAERVAQRIEAEKPETSRMLLEAVIALEHAACILLAATAQGVAEGEKN